MSSKTLRAIFKCNLCLQT